MLDVKSTFDENERLTPLTMLIGCFFSDKFFRDLFVWSYLASGCLVGYSVKVTFFDTVDDYFSSSRKLETYIGMMLNSLTFLLLILLVSP